MVRFVRFSYYKTANRTAPCGVVRCGYAILQAVLVQFLWFVQFMRFGEHPYIQQQILHLFFYHFIQIFLFYYFFYH